MSGESLLPALPLHTLDLMSMLQEDGQVFRTCAHPLRLSALTSRPKGLRPPSPACPGYVFSVHADRWTTHLLM